MRRPTLPGLFGMALLITLAAPAGAQSQITEQEAHAIGVNAYLYFYSLITMDVTRKQMTDAWTEGFKKNAGSKVASLASSIDMLNAAMADLPKGSKLAFSYAPGAGTSVTIDGVSKTVIPGADFAAALISIWLGDPPNKEVKTGLLGGKCE